MRPSRRSAAAVTAFLGALAIAAPVTNVSAATTPGTAPVPDLSALASLPGLASLPAIASLPALASLPAALSGLPLSFDPSIPGATVAKAPTVVDSTFNGATVVQVLNGAPTNSSIVGSP